VSRGPDLGSCVPLDPPWAWEDTGDGEFVFWAFLEEVCRHHADRPWLIVEESPSSLGPVRFVLPRLAPECGWPDAEAYRKWEEATWGEGAETIVGALSLEQAVDRLPRSPTRPRWADSEHIVALAMRADIHGRSAVDIAAEDGDDQLAGDPVRTIRKQIARGRQLLAEIGVLPWAILDLQTQPDLRHEWWRQPAFAEGLRSWRGDATNLSWRRARELTLPTDPARDAAGLVLRSPWVTTDPRTLPLAQSRLRRSAQEFSGDVEDWLRNLIAFSHQTRECREDLVRRADADGSASELRSIWAASRMAA